MTRPRSPRLLSPLLLLVALITVLTAGTVSASAAHGPETRVRAIPTTTAAAVGQPSSETAGHVGCLRPPDAAIASGSCVATEAAGGSLDSSVVYRYVSEGEANAAAKVGRVPNTDVLGQPRSVFYSPDYIDSVAEAEQSLQIGAMNPGGATASPGFRITASPQGAQWTYGGNVAGGSGIEMLTEQALKVLRIDRLPR